MANHTSEHFEPFYNSFQIEMVSGKVLRTIREEMIESSCDLDDRDPFRHLRKARNHLILLQITNLVEIFDLKYFEHEKYYR